MTQAKDVDVARASAYCGIMHATIRPAREDDALRLPAIERSAGEIFRTLPKLAWIADDDVLTANEHRALIRQGASWVAVDDLDEPLGFLSAERTVPELHIRELAVRHGSQGQGIGRTLLATAIAWAEANSFEAVTLTTFRRLAWNEAFYASMGFATLKPGQLGPRLAAILEAEAANGFLRKDRCAMRLVLSTGRAIP
ncbi:N-acetyltransferase GCN5 [Agaricicola taiwanensis]|uniref:N-acetyltransferase GCN5 n=1 Tax=Agaricicola taiwanensis TaxID=591372 RepID=A0A8J2YKI7_9RHOB|nr:GNAT family N-acetyltransferase [Agaricicola taiwanensis]GGE49976.1 N-acetyltransferase GCN5 [Agaricicola taiwanensis]